MYVCKALNFHPTNARSTIIAGWAGGRQMGKLDGKLPEWGLNSWTSGPEHNHYTTQPCTHEKTDVDYDRY